MQKTLLTLICLTLLIQSAVAQPQPTRKGSDATVHHGQSVADPYRWLEQADEPEVKSWIEQQNRWVEQNLSKYAGREQLAKRVGELSLTSPSQYAPTLAGGTLLFMRQVPPQPQPVLVGQDWPTGGERILVDTNRSEHPSAITNFWPSPSGRYVAYGTAEGGSELTTIYFVEVASGKKLRDRLPHAGGGTTPPALIWDADESGVTYVRMPLPSETPPAERLFNASLYHHRLGTPATQDEPAFGQGLSRVAEWELTTSGDGKHAAAMVHFGDGAPYRVYLRTPQGWKLAVGEKANIRSGGSWRGDQLLLVSFQNKPRGRVFGLSPRRQTRGACPPGPMVDPKRPPGCWRPPGKTSLGRPATTRALD